jgi:cysteinyl-tRNA synthetase
MYTCGPTIYDSAHVGNFRAFLTYDVLKRVLLYFGYDVTHVCNLTDVDDKIITKCRERGMTVEELTKLYETAFREDLAALNIVPAQHYPRATQHIQDMVELVEGLRAKDLAYQTPDGSWYFHTQNQPKYGTQLVHLAVDDMESQDRTDDDSGKKHFQDFCLWKAYKEGVDRTDCSWDTSLGYGRPGWHLECSAMARVFLGDTIDIHCGGIDLKFPHHENEIAQSEGFSGKTFCNCWIHNGFVNIGGEKMSKSTGNFLTLRAACPKPDDVRAYRYLVVSSQYRNPLSFTDQVMDASLKALKRMDKVKAGMGAALTAAAEAAGTPVDGTPSPDDVLTMVHRELDNFDAALLDDLSMPRAAASLFNLIKAAETIMKDAARGAPMDLVGLQAVSDGIDRMDRVFGIFYPLLGETDSVQGEDEEVSNVIPTAVLDLVGQRAAAKDAQEWDLADSLRTRITELGYKVKDVKGGGDPIVSRLE